VFEEKLRRSITKSLILKNKDRRADNNKCRTLFARQSDYMKKKTETLNDESDNEEKT